MTVGVFWELNMDRHLAMYAIFWTIPIKVVAILDACNMTMIEWKEFHRNSPENMPKCDCEEPYLLSYKVLSALSIAVVHTPYFGTDILARFNRAHVVIYATTSLSRVEEPFVVRGAIFFCLHHYDFLHAKITSHRNRKPIR